MRLLTTLSCLLLGAVLAYSIPVYAQEEAVESPAVELSAEQPAPVEQVEPTTEPSVEPSVVVEEILPGVTSELNLSEIGLPLDGDLPEAITEDTKAEAEEEVAEQAAPVVREWWKSGYVTLLALVLVFFLSSYIANACSKAWRMPEHNLRIFILLLCFLGGVSSTFLGWHRLTLGIDLRGGVILVYDVLTKADSGSDEKAATAKDTSVDMDQLTRALGMRINPGGVREISITKLGTNQIRIIIPQAEDAEVARIERMISESGALEFRILASTRYDKDGPIIDLAKAESGKTVYATDGSELAFWVPAAPGEAQRFDHDPALTTRKRGKELEVLVLADDYNITGADISSIRETRDERNQLALGFNLNADGGNRFYALTNENKKDPVNPDRVRLLGIIMNGQLYSAPRLNAAIRSNGIIEFGQRNTVEEKRQLQQEISDLIAVMNAGSLPADLSKEPASRLITGATLGEDTINKGMNSMLIGGAVILLFMVGYYRTAGLIACFAVVMNFFLIMTVMLALRSAFTLPGLAGLILTLGMAIDANILIFERMREELANGATLRMAIRNGFDRAFTAIIDTNLTSLIVGFILYAVGNEQIKGFAVTLILGVTFTMFTAIYCCRTIFDILERTKTITTLTMNRFLDKPNFDFMGKWRICVTFSVICTVVSLAATGIRGRDILDIDFIGGVSVEAVFTKPQKIGDIRDALNKKENDLPAISVSEVQLDAASAQAIEKETGMKTEPHTRFIINTSIKPEFNKNPNENLAYLAGVMKKEFGDDLVYQVLHSEIDEAASQITSATPDSEAVSDAETSTDQIVARLTVEPLMNQLAIHSKIDGLMKAAVEKGVLANTFNFTMSHPESVSNPANLQSGGTRSGSWILTMHTSRANAEALLKEMETRHENPYFPTSTTIGGAVARYAQIQAILAVTGSLVCIVAYMWFRFHRAMYGIVAAIGLVHDVIVTLGCVALSLWLAPFLGFVGVFEFKIGLPEVAAFLMVIGYSLNDTIILFDRIREIKGKLPYISMELVNKGINQTLSRTLLTSFSTAFVLLVLYCFGGAGIHTFSFILLVGVVFGTYSSVYIASVLLYAFASFDEKKK